MKNIIVVNGETDWGSYFPREAVHHRRLQTSQWLLQKGRLWVFDNSGALPVDAVLWRVGAIKPQPMHRSILELIRLAGIHCVNPASTLLRGYDRLGMLNELREAGLPLLDFDVALGENVLSHLEPNLPAVLKIGNFHGGFGKAKANSRDAWNDMVDLAFVTDDYASIEPFIDYARDIRCLAIGDQMWAMERRSRGWKVNRGAIDYQLIEFPPTLAGYTQKAMRHFGADILGIDFLETKEGAYFTLESNDIPGLSGFPEEARKGLALCLRRKLDS